MKQTDIREIMANFIPTKRYNVGDKVFLMGDVDLIERTLVANTGDDGQYYPLKIDPFDVTLTKYGFIYQDAIFPSIIPATPENAQTLLRLFKGEAMPEPISNNSNYPVDTNNTTTNILQFFLLWLIGVLSCVVIQFLKGDNSLVQNLMLTTTVIGVAFIFYNWKKGQ